MHFCRVGGVWAQTMRPGGQSKAWLRFRFMQFCGMKCNNLSRPMRRWLWQPQWVCPAVWGCEPGHRVPTGVWAKCGSWRVCITCVLIFCRLALQYFVICKPLWIYLLFSCLFYEIFSRWLRLFMSLCVCVCVSMCLRRNNAAYAWFSIRFSGERVFLAFCVAARKLKCRQAKIQSLIWWLYFFRNALDIGPSSEVPFYLCARSVFWIKESARFILFQLAGWRAVRTSYERNQQMCQGCWPRKQN